MRQIPVFGSVVEWRGASQPPLSQVGSRTGADDPAGSAYSIPPQAVGRPLTLLASDIGVRVLDGSVEIARHVRTYDRHHFVLDPAHREAVLDSKRKAFHSMPAGRLEQVVPESTAFFDIAFTQGESAGTQTAN